MVFWQHPFGHLGYDRLMRHPHLKTCLLHDCCGRIPSQAQILIDIVPSIHTSTSNIETKVAKFYLHVILLARPYFLRCKACQLGSQSLYRLKGTWQLIRNFPKWIAFPNTCARTHTRQTQIRREYSG